MSCPVPFLSAADFPATGGYLPGRLCSAVTSTLTCCLPCNKQKWTYTNEFNRNLDVAFWLNVPSLIALVLLLVTFTALPEKQSHRHYLNIGLCVGLSLLCIAFVIPLASRPDYCYNEITPRDMYSSNQCAASGAFFIAGTLTATSWVLARSLWIHLRLCWNFKDERILMWPMNFVGWVLPAILFAVAIPVTTVSFRLGDTCLPGQKYPFLTYLGWLMAFGILALIFQLATTFYCLWIYLREVISGPAPGTTRSGTHGRFGPAVSSQAQNGENTVARRGSDTPTARKATWRRTKVVLKTQWRSILLSFIVSADTVLYGSIFAAQDAKTARIMAGTEDSRLVEWATCLILNDLDPNKCRGIPNLLNEKAFIANFILAAINGLLIFAAMYRTSMATGWWYIIRHGRRQPEAEDHFKIVPMKRRTPAQKLESDRYNPAPHEIDPTLLNPMPHPYQPDSHAQRSPASISRSYEPSLIDFEGQDDSMPSRGGQKPSFNSSPLRSNPPHGPGLLHDAPDTPDSRKPSARGSDTTAIGTPEPGDAAKRHETTTWFEENSSDDEEVGAPRQRTKFNDIV